MRVRFRFRLRAGGDGRRRRPVKTLSIVASMSLLASLAGCQQESKIVEAASTSPVTPIVLKIAHGGLVKVAEDDPDPDTKVIALIGVFLVDQLQSAVGRAQAKAQHDGNTTLLLVNQTIDGKAETSLFTIGTGRKLVVAMNGRFVETIEPMKITITAVPNTDSTIVITDANAGQLPYITAKVNLSPRDVIDRWLLGDHSQVDLDTGHDKDLGSKAAGTADLVVPSPGTLRTANGAVVAPWTGTDPPTLATCSSLPAEKWTTTLYGSAWSSMFDGWNGKALCVRSSQGRYGVLNEVRASTGYAWTFDYVLWKKPDDH